MAKTIKVTVTAYEGDVAFPEAEYYPEFLADEIRRSYPEFEVEVRVGPRTYAIVDPGDLGDGRDLEHEIESMAKVDAWDAFCAHGYKEFSENVIDDQIEALRAEAAAAGDIALRATAERALAGDEECRAVCAEIIEESRARSGREG